MTKPLVIVESPAKAKTIAKILGEDFVVESSIGHIRDLPESAADIPAAYKGEPWARLGVDVDNDFKALYVVPKGKKKQVDKLKRLLKAATELYLATDEDREGESIAWHLCEELSPRVPVKRMVFHEITPHAVRDAAQSPREIDRKLVDAQEGRRILDRLYGYEVSPVLWKKVAPRLSAGRVQSVATRLVVERERARMRFRRATYWDVEGEFRPASGDDRGPFKATLVAVDGRRLATGKDFDESGRVVRDVVVLDERAAHALLDGLRAAAFGVRSVDERPYRSSPHAPFITSTLQRAAARLGFSSARTMQVAQRLYENGYITYMRTDSVTLSESAIATARAQAKQLYGPEYVPDRPRHYTRKVKNAQEAHEAIRPAGEVFRTPRQLAGELSREELRLYELIWKRTIASQMADATGKTVQVRLGARAATGRDAEFGTSGTVITFRGHLQVGLEDEDETNGNDEAMLPQLESGQPLDALALEPRGRETKPPGRYSEASLVKELEDRGIGRPSTYASIIQTILDRGYVWKKGTALVPSWTAFAVVSLLENHFARLVDYDFTAAMEEDLDDIANGDEETVPWLRRFYFGNGDAGLHHLVTTHIDEIDPREINCVSLGSDDGGEEIAVRVGRYGPYLQRGDDTVSIAEDIPPDELTVAKAIELIEAPSEDRVLGVDPETGKDVHLKVGRYGPYVQLGEIEEGSKDKPRTASLFASMDPSTVGLDDALRLLSLPRVVGRDLSDDSEIVALTGRFGPYLKKGKETRSLDTEEQVFSITLEEALARFAEPKRGRARTAQALRDLGADPATGAQVQVKVGRYGPYVTDGGTNASIPRGESAESITLERAVQLLADKRAAGPTKKKKKTTRRKKK